MSQMHSLSKTPAVHHRIGNCKDCCENGKESHQDERGYGSDLPPHSAHQGSSEHGLNQSQTFGYPHCNGREKAHIQKVQPGLDYESTARGVHKFQYPRQEKYCTGNECAKPAESVV